MIVNLTTFFAMQKAAILLQGEQFCNENKKVMDLSIVYIMMYVHVGVLKLVLFNN